MCGSCPTNKILDSRRSARTSPHVSTGDAIGVNFDDGTNASSYPNISAANSAVCRARKYGLVTIIAGATPAVLARFSISRSRLIPSGVNARLASACPGRGSSAMPCRSR